MVLFESIKIVDGVVYNVPYHLARMQRAQLIYFKDAPLIQTINIIVPKQYQIGVVKCKVIYDSVIIEMQFEHYQKRIVQNYKCISDDNISYSHKYLDRTELNFYQPYLENFVEVLIIKHAMVTDAVYSNVCFWDGVQWFTPKYPLLKGTMRAKLLHENKIKEALILQNEIPFYKRISFINAMNDLGERVIEI